MMFSVSYNRARSIFVGGHREDDETCLQCTRSLRGKISYLVCRAALCSPKRTPASHQRNFAVQKELPGGDTPCSRCRISCREASTLSTVEPPVASSRPGSAIN